MCEFVFVGCDDAGEVLLGSGNQGKHLVFIRQDETQRPVAGWQMVKRSLHNRESPLPPTQHYYFAHTRTHTMYTHTYAITKRWIAYTCSAYCRYRNTWREMETHIHNTLICCIKITYRLKFRQQCISTHIKSSVFMQVQSCWMCTFSKGTRGVFCNFFAINQLQPKCMDWPSWGHVAWCNFLKHFYMKWCSCFHLLKLYCEYKHTKQFCKAFASEDAPLKCFIHLPVCSHLPISLWYKFIGCKRSFWGMEIEYCGLHVAWDGYWNTSKRLM